MNQFTSMSVLFTSAISPTVKQAAQNLGLNVQTIPFIKSKPILPENLDKQINTAKEATQWIFTSKNALAVFKHAPKLIALTHTKDIIVAGAQTQQALQLLGITSQFSEPSGAKGVIKLLQSIEKGGSVLYFSGKQRLDILPNYLTESQTDWFEWVVYETVEKSHTVNQKDFNVVAFCSPSAVKSFFKNNSPHEEIKYLAIGKTTQECLQQYTTHSFVSEKATMVSMLDFCKQLESK